MQYAGVLRRRTAPVPRELASGEPPKLFLGCWGRAAGLSPGSVLHRGLSSPLGEQVRGAGCSGVRPAQTRSLQCDDAPDPAPQLLQRALVAVGWAPPWGDRGLLVPPTVPGDGRLPPAASGCGTGRRHCRQEGRGRGGERREERSWGTAVAARAAPSTMLFKVSQEASAALSRFALNLSH